MIKSNKTVYINYYTCVYRCIADLYSLYRQIKFSNFREKRNENYIIFINLYIAVKYTFYLTNTARKKNFLTLNFLQQR